jgi:ABC-2 type transport system permease protein
MLSQQQWLNSYVLMLRWQGLRLKPILPLATLVQLLIGAGTVIGLGYMVPQIDHDTALYLSTGAPTLTLVALGLVLVPQMVADAKSKGAFEYMWSLPIPRLAFLAADLTVWLLVALPGVILALIAGSLYYGFRLQVSPLVVPAFLMVTMMATTVGYAIAHLSPKPELVAVITNFLVFALFLFSPINFPAERLPGWLAELHRFLPVEHAANIVRGTLTEGYADNLGLSFAVVGIWLLVGFGLTYAAVSRRQ